jgi:hypothetical protein
VPESALTRLLAFERELEAMLAESRARAASVVATAESAARAAQAVLEAELSDATTRLAARLKEESRVRAEVLDRESTRMAEQLDRLTDGEIDGLAEWVVAQVVDGPDRSASGDP